MVAERSFKTGPRRGWYLVALAFFLTGFGLMAALLVMKLPSVADNLTQIVVPGKASLTLEPGDYTIFHEDMSVVNGKIYNTGPISGLMVFIQGPDGKPVSLAESSVNSRYSLGSRRGTSTIQFTITQPGLYKLEAAYKGEAGPETVLAVGQGFMSSLLTIIFGGLAFVFGGAGLAVTVIVMVRRKFRRALLENVDKFTQHR